MRKMQLSEPVVCLFSLRQLPRREFQRLLLSSRIRRHLGGAAVRQYLDGSIRLDTCVSDETLAIYNVLPLTRIRITPS